MAKKPAPEINIADEIRRYLDQHPGVKPRDASRALTAKLKTNVSAKYVSLVKNSRQKTDAAAAPVTENRGPGRPPIVNQSPAREGGDVSLADLLRAKELAAEFGGIEKLKIALEGIEKISE